MTTWERQKASKAKRSVWDLLGLVSRRGRQEVPDGKSTSENVELLRKGSTAWNSWRDDERIAAARGRMRREDLYDMIYLRAWAIDLRLCMPVLVGADLQDASLEGVDFMGAQIYGVDFRGADLRNARFDGASLSSANLQGTDFRGANFLGAELSALNVDRARFDGATFGDTVLREVDLRRALGLEEIKHDGPSPIDVESLFRSGGDLPSKFLRGLGVPEPLINQVGSLALDGDRYYSCFISYSTHDQAFATRLFGDLQEAGVRCWFAGHDMKGGQKLDDQIKSAIRGHDKLLLVLSRASTSSNWVRSEIAEARAREETEERRVLFPITLMPFEELRSWSIFDADRGSDSAREIREYYIPDFSSGEGKDYSDAFDRLLDSLKIEDD